MDGKFGAEIFFEKLNGCLLSHIEQVRERFKQQEDVLVQKEEWAAMSVMDEHKEKLDAWATLDGKAWTPRLTEADTALAAWQELLIQVDSLSEGLGHPIMTELQNDDTAEAVRSCIYEHCGDANVDADGLQNWWEANKRRRLQ